MPATQPRTPKHQTPARNIATLPRARKPHEPQTALERAKSGAFVKVELDIARAFDSLDVAAFIAYVTYWQDLARDNWCYRSRAQFRADIILSRRQLDALIIRLGPIVIIEKRGYPLRTYYRINRDEIEKVLTAFYSVGSVRSNKRQLDHTDPPVGSHRSNPVGSHRSNINNIDLDHIQKEIQERQGDQKRKRDLQIGTGLSKSAEKAKTQAAAERASVTQAELDRVLTSLTERTRSLLWAHIENGTEMGERAGRAWEMFLRLRDGRPNGLQAAPGGR